jgi:hypothetical protein
MVMQYLKSAREARQMTDRELLLLLFDAIRALALKLTGEHLVIDVEHENGFNSVRSYRGRWLSPEAAQTLASDFQKGCSIQKEDSGEHPAIG